jgi:hypothetical protein
MTHRAERFVYSAENVPTGGIPGEILTKVGTPNYYTAWRDLTYIFETHDVILDDGEY